VGHNRPVSLASNYNCNESDHPTGTVVVEGRCARQRGKHGSENGTNAQVLHEGVHEMAHLRVIMTYSPYTHIPHRQHSSGAVNDS
jgi:hypothetical protein